MKKALKVSKSIELKWTEESQSLIRDYWIERGFKISTASGGCISGRRGHFFHNLTGYNMARLRCKLVVCERNADQIVATMEVDTTGQIITEENGRFFELEMDTFESVMRSGDRLERVWRDFRKKQRRSNFLWTITLGLYGFRPLLQAVIGAIRKPNKP